jgi:hypothetical protein
VEKKFDAPLDHVFCVLTDARWLEERCRALGELGASCKTTRTGGVVVTMKRRVRRELPALLARFFAPENDIVLEERWSSDDGGHRAAYTLEVVGQPVTIAAEIQLVREGRGCVYRIRHQCKARVPLIGGAVEKFMVGQTEAGCADELAYLADYLERHKRAGAPDRHPKPRLRKDRTT